MDGLLLLRGLGLGFVIAAAVGPISLLCIRRTLAEGSLVGFVSGLGAATADATYGAIAAFGLTAVSDLLVGQQRPLALVGGAALILIGWRIAHTPPPAGGAGEAPTRRLAAAYGSVVALTLTNPLTILSFVAAFAALGLGAGSGGLGAAVSLVLGVFAGSTAWWALLAWLVSRLRGRLTPLALRWVNRASGTAIAVFGVVAAAEGLLRA